MHEGLEQLPDILTIGQAARLLNVHVDTLRRWDRDGTLRAVRIGGKSQRRYSKATVLAARGTILVESALHRMDSRQLLTQMARLLRTVSASLDSRLMAQTVVDEAVQVIGSTQSAIFLLDETHHHVVPFVDAKRNDGQPTRLHAYPDSIPLTAQPLFTAVQTSDAVICISDTYDDPRTTRAFFAPFDIRALIVAPLRMRNTTLLGMLCFFWTGSPRLFTQEERIFAEALANQTAVGLENARLHERLAHISELAKARAAQLSAVINSVADGVLVYDIDNRIVLANQKMTELFGIAKSGIKGLTAAQFDEHIRPLCVPVPDAEQKERSTESSQPRTVVIELATPSRRTIQRFLTPVVDQSGAVLGGVALYHDITAERALAQTKDHFLSVATHELRTPLTVLSGYAGMLVRTAREAAPRPAPGENVSIPEDTWHHVLHDAEMVHDEARRLNDLFEVLLDFSHMTSHTMGMQKQACHLLSLIHRSVRHVQLSTTRHTLEVVTRGAIDDRVLADPQRIEQVVRNLLENAIKYMPDGGRIQITVSHTAATATSPAAIQIAVHDEGIGVPEGQQSAIFDKFYRATNVPRETVGLGLGLAICAEIIQWHGGRIWMESAGEQPGSTFMFTLPLETSIQQE